MEKKETKNREKVEDEKVEENEEDNINEGANDLMNLPIETLRDELKKRGYHAGIVDRMEKWFLASTLRESAHFSSDVPFYGRSNRTSRNHGGNSAAPIFDVEKKKKEDEEEKVKSEEEEKKEESENESEKPKEEFDISKFKAKDKDGDGSKAPKIVQPPIAPIKQQTMPNLFNQVAPPPQPPVPVKPNPWKRNNMGPGLDEYVPIEDLEALPQEKQQKIQADIKNGVDFPDIMAKYLIPCLAEFYKD